MSRPDDSQPTDWQAIIREARSARPPRTFKDNDDEGYRRWLRSHPNGFVVDTDSVPPRGTPMIHTARCTHIAHQAWVDGLVLDHPYSYTRPPNAKLCAESESSLLEYCRSVLPAGHDVMRCKDCT